MTSAVQSASTGVSDDGYAALLQKAQQHTIRSTSGSPGLTKEPPPQEANSGNELQAGSQRLALGQKALGGQVAQAQANTQQNIKDVNALTELSGNIAAHNASNQYFNQAAQLGAQGTEDPIAANNQSIENMQNAAAGILRKHGIEGDKAKEVMSNMANAGSAENAQAIAANALGVNQSDLAASNRAADSFNFNMMSRPSDNERANNEFNNKAMQNAQAGFFNANYIAARGQEVAQTVAGEDATMQALSQADLRPSRYGGSADATSGNGSGADGQSSARDALVSGMVDAGKSLSSNFNLAQGAQQALDDASSATGIRAQSATGLGSTMLNAGASVADNPGLVKLMS